MLGFVICLPLEAVTGKIHFVARDSRLKEQEEEKRKKKKSLSTSSLEWMRSQ